MLKKIIKRLIIVIVLISLLLMGYLHYLTTTLPYSEPLREYPWWEKYTSYWGPHWSKILTEQKSFDSDGKACEEVNQYQKFGITISKVMWCLTLDKELVRKRLGLFNMPLHTKAWYFDAEEFDLREAVWKQFPNGPHAWLDPRQWHTYEYVRPITDDEFVFHFHISAHYSEPNSLGHSDWVVRNIRQWQGPVNIIIDDFARSTVEGQPAREFIAEYVAELAQLTGLEINLVERGKAKGNFLIAIYFRDQSEQVVEFINELAKESGEFHSPYHDYKLRQNILRKDSPCSGLNLNDEGKIYYTHLFITFDKKEKRLGCLHEEIIQGFGLVGDARNADPSIFNDYSPYEIVTEHDKILLQMLYDDRIQPNMTEEQTIPIVQQIIKEYRQAGKLDLLTKKVYSFYPADD